MDILGNGLITLVNGAWSALTTLASPLVLMGVATVIASLWLVLVEIDEMNRQGSKPEVGRH